MPMISPDVKVIISTEFIRKFSSSIFKLKKLISDGDIKATKRNWRYIINAHDANNWYKSLFDDHIKAA
jgi:hypothetical protein